MTIKSFKKFINLKSGKIHDDFRKEIEIKFNRDDFEKLEELGVKLTPKAEFDKKFNYYKKIGKKF